MIILIDSNYLSHYVSFRNQGFSHNGKPTGTVFGFLKSILSLSRTFNSNRFVFAWDSRRSLRKLDFPGYKKREKKSEEEEVRLLELFRQMVELRTDVLPRFGFRNIFLRTGFEADDVIAGICQDRLDEEMCIVSNDNDLFQILSNNHCMYDIKKKARYTHKDFTKEYGILPMQWVDVKGLAGCIGDKVPGVSGVGVKTAIRYIEGTLPEKSRAFREIVRANNDGTVVNTRLLVELPYSGLEPFHLEEAEVFGARDFLDICDEYGFRSFERDEQAWRQQFSMRTGGR